MTVKMKKPSALIQTFKAAGRLVNEWRDTLLYGGLLTGAVVNAYLGNPVPPNFILASVVGATYLRETTRALSWVFTKEHCVAGASIEKKRPLKQCKNAAIAMAQVSSGLAISAFPIIYSDPSMGTLCLVNVFALLPLRNTIICVKKTGGGKEMLDTIAYIWDWPRKNKDGGHTQTEKARKGLHGFMQKIKPSPIPVPQPA